MKFLLERVLKHFEECSEDPNTEMMSFEERAFWFMLNTVFHCINEEWLIDNEIDYQLDNS